jgi:two-component system chemotaxis response regulator CheY
MTKIALAVDDSRTIRQMVSFTLKNIGYEVFEAEDGLEAIELLKTKKPDVIITDLNMPNLDGIGLIKHIREVLGLRSVPILMLTTEYTDDKKNVGREAGATGWIVKPFDPEKLVQVVQKICG